MKNNKLERLYDCEAIKISTQILKKYIILTPYGANDSWLALQAKYFK